MKLTISTALSLVALSTLIPQSAAAFPVAGSYVDQGGGSNCDNTHGPMFLTEELGPAGAGFPLDEQIVVSISATAQQVSCAFVSPLADFEVTMTNTSPDPYRNLFFVLAAGFAAPQFPRDGQARRTAFRSPWQNGTAERFVGSVRRELLDHVVVLSEAHLRRLLREYVEHYNTERVHTSLGDAPAGRPTEAKPSDRARVVVLPRVGGLHHRYAWREAA